MPVAPGRSVQPPPTGPQRCHWKENAIGPVPVQAARAGGEGLAHAGRAGDRRQGQRRRGIAGVDDDSGRDRDGRRRPGDVGGRLADAEGQSEVVGPDEVGGGGRPGHVGARGPERVAALPLKGEGERRAPGPRPGHGRQRPAEERRPAHRGRGDRRGRVDCRGDLRRCVRRGGGRADAVRPRLAHADRPPDVGLAQEVGGAGGPCDVHAPASGRAAAEPLEGERDRLVPRPRPVARRQRLACAKRARDRRWRKRGRGVADLEDELRRAAALLRGQDELAGRARQGEEEGDGPGAAVLAGVREPVAPVADDVPGGGVARA